MVGVSTCAIDRIDQIKGRGAHHQFGIFGFVRRTVTAVTDDLSARLRPPQETVS